MGPRRRPPSEEELAALRELGAGEDVISGIVYAPSREEAERRLAAMKQVVKVRFRASALELHPDRTGGDPVKTERFKLLAGAAERAAEIELPEVQAPAPPRVWGSYGPVTVCVTWVFVDPV